MSDTTRRILTYGKYATTPAGFSSSSYISISRFYNAQNEGFFALFINLSRFYTFISHKNMSPFLTWFPRLPTAEPCGQGNTRLSHVKCRPLIMPLVALVQKNRAHPQLRTFVWCDAIDGSAVAIRSSVPYGTPFLGALRLAFATS